ncbi:MAG: hypothetical protein E7581_01905 [Ruminococcaceae bacterium]|nr:hypothetical protein [Oscillospiraceae bacterium]
MTEVSGLSIFWIKIIAALTMVIDHAAAVGQFTGWEICRMIGRVSFPLYAFMLVQGFLHTRSRWRYLLQLLALALLSQPIYTYCFNGVWWKWDHLNILFTLAASLGAMWLLDLGKRVAQRRKGAWWLWALLLCMACCGTVFAGEFLGVDYGWEGMVLILMLYVFATTRWAWCPITVLFAFRNQLLTGAWDEPVYQRGIFAAVAFIPMVFYNGKPGPKPKNKVWAAAMKYGFYAFYPLHLLVLAVVF